MENLDDSENNAKVSDSAYSNSCSNSQSRRSRSSKSTHSGSNSSGSSGYGGKPSTSGSSNNIIQPAEKRSKDKDGKKKKKAQAETLVVRAEVECRPPDPAPIFEVKEVVIDALPSPPLLVQVDTGIEKMDTTPEKKTSDEAVSCHTPQPTAMNIVTSRPSSSPKQITDMSPEDGFSCVISMHDGVVMYSTTSLTTTLGFPKDMWIGRSFIDFVHPLDHSTFASQITNGLAVPKNANGTQEAVQTSSSSGATMFCRIRRYRGLNSGFGVKDRTVSFMPFLLKLSFKNINDDQGLVVYLVIQATPLFSAFKTPCEAVMKSVPFVMRHVSNGNLEFIDNEAVPYLGYLPQDVTGKNVLQLYHPEDLGYIRQVYETIVKEGGVSKSKPYRLMAQNGDYLKLETEWSSFINPWSRKLEFVIGKHHVVEGPNNPDVFQSPTIERKISEEDKNKAQGLRESIVRILNEVLTKPAEIAKQQMTKRCQDLASFMESLMEDQPKAEEELRLEIQEPDNSYYERDSVMLGGISPHHDYNDSKSSTTTPLSYNQLNFNENLQRYFNSHQRFSIEDYQTAAGESILRLADQGSTFTERCMSPMAQNSGDSAELTSSGESTGLAVGESSPIMIPGEYQPLRLTESLLNKHNVDMEKKLVKKHRESRSSNKEDREKASNETKQKKKAHLARCNATFQPTLTGSAITELQPHGVKRGSKQLELDSGSHKHHCPSPRQSRRRQLQYPNQNMPSTITTAIAAATHWPTNSTINPFMSSIGMSQQMSLLSPVAVPGMFPMYYVPTAGPGLQSNSDMNNTYINNNTGHFQTPAVQYMMYGQAVFGSPFVYSPINHQASMPLQQNIMSQYTNTPSQNSLGLTASNYEEACKPGTPLMPGKSYASLYREKRRAAATTSNADQVRGVSSSICSSTNALNRGSEAQGDCGSAQEQSMDQSADMSSGSLKSTEAVPALTLGPKKTKGNDLTGSEEAIDRTDGESSYSSFYSSFFKTESGSATDSGDAKKATDKNSLNNIGAAKDNMRVNKITRRKMEPPWMEQVCVTSELVYKYQILTKNLDEVLLADKQKMTTLEQPNMVNEQLGQLYMDLQLEGVAARLTLEEGMTSSGSSGEETNIKISKDKRAKRKREYSKLVMIYEEDAPFPPPMEDAESVPGTSTS